ncbi:MAG: hypothetical protein MJY86_04715 [Bacteroidales bacterium]|nr:hypothetical protein [Bacteroidales bacterium]
MGITMFISLWVTRLVLNSLGESDFGIFNVVGGAIAMLGFLNISMAAATQRFMSVTQGGGNLEDQKTVFNVSLTIHLVLALIVALILLLLGYVFFSFLLDIPSGREHAAVVVYASLVVSTMFTFMTVPYDAVLNAHENMRYYAIIGVLESLLKLAVAFVCVYTSLDKLIVYGILMACIPLLTLSIMRAYCHRHYSECVVSPKRYFSNGTYHEMVSFAGWNLLGTVSTMIANYGIGLVLNYFFGTIVNAAQGVANQLNGQVLAFSNNLMKAVNPVISKSEGSGDHRMMLNVTMTGSKFSYVMIAIFAIPLVLEMPYVLRLWLKNVPDYAVVFTQLIVVKSSLEQMTNLFNTSISADGRVKGLHILNSVASIMTLFLGILVFAAGADPSSIYILLLLAFGVIVPVGKLVIMKKNCAMSYSSFLKCVFFPMLAVTAVSAVTGLLVRGFMAPSFLRLVLVSMSCASSFIVAMYIVGINSSERMLIWNALKGNR